MSVVPLAHLQIVAAAMFAVGLVGVLVRRNVLFMLLSLEIMLNAVGLAFVAAGAHHGAADGQVMYLLVLTLAAVEVAVGLALVIRLERRFDSLDVDRAAGLGDRP